MNLSIHESEWLAAGYVPIRDRVGLDGKRYITIERESSVAGE